MVSLKSSEQVFLDFLTIIKTSWWVINGENPVEIKTQTIIDPVVWSQNGRNTNQDICYLFNLEIKPNNIFLKDELCDMKKFMLRQLM